VTLLLLDEDWGKVDPAAARRMGYRGIIGYVSQDNTGKNLTRPQVDAIHAQGMDVGLVYEYNPKSALGGYTQGAVDGGIAVAHARSIGAPAGMTLYAAVDWDVTAAQLSTVHAYARGFSDQMHANGYQAGIYGGYAVCWYLSQSVWLGRLWQTYAWSGGKWAPNLSVRQVRNGVHVSGVAVDDDETDVTDWGQWSADGTYPRHSEGGDVSQTTDNIVKAWSVGSPTTVDESGQTISIAPVDWQIKFEAWRDQVTASLAAIATALSTFGANTGSLTQQQSDDLHTIADDLRKLTA